MHLLERTREFLVPVRDWLRWVNAETSIVLRQPRHGRPHGLPGELIITLTSYPPRYPTLHKTLVSLLMQRVAPDRIVLWVADAACNLPRKVQDLQSVGLEIRQCEDIRSYKKIIPSLEAFPESFLVTADDDLYYEPNWLDTLVAGADEIRPIIVCRRAHRPKRNAGGLAPYLSWDHDVITNGEIDDFIFPTSGGGALYPPGSLSREVTDRAFLDLCPYADDAWLFVMARRAGTPFRQVGGGFAQVPWRNSQAKSLMQYNLTDEGNDKQLASVIDKYPIF